MKPSTNLIVDSGATHHMWNDALAFVSFIPTHDSYKTVANNVKVDALFVLDLIANNSHCYISFPNFTLNIDDATDMVLPLTNCGKSYIDTSVLGIYETSKPYNQ